VLGGDTEKPSTYASRVHPSVRTRGLR